MSEPSPDQIPELRGGAAKAPADPMSKLVLSLVDGRAALADIAETSGVSIDLVTRIASALERDGIIRFGKTSDPASRPSCPSEVETDEGAASAAGDSARRIEEFEARVSALESDIGARNYYEVLAVEPDADGAAIKHAYFELSKMYHPDRAFGPGAAQLRKKMDVIFRHLNRAYEALSSEKERSAYDAHIADQIALWKIGRELKRAAEAAKEPTDKEPSAKAPQRKPISSQAPTKTPPGKEHSAQVSAREAELKRMSWKKERISRAFGMVLPTNSEPPKTCSDGELQKKMEDAALAIEVERYGDAVRLLEAVLAENASFPNARELFRRAEAGAARKLSSGYLRQARFERMHGDSELALEHFDKAIGADGSNLDARYQLAEMLLEKRMNLGRALTLCREVIGLGGQRAKYFATMGDILLLSKDKTRAAEAFERALEIEPDNKDLRKKWKLCKG